MLRTFLKHVSLLLTLAGLALSLCAWLGWDRRPNVILISIDTLRADHLGAYGYPRPTSPALDRFRRDAVLFREAIAHAPSTLPSHASIFTSLVPQHHGASHTQNRPLSPDAVTLPEVLRKHGYRTLAVANSGQLAPAFGLGQGFDVYESREGGTFRQIVDRGLRLLGKPSSKPFFLFLHSYEIHHPYTPSPARLAPFDAGYAGALPDRISVELLAEINEGRRKIEPADRQHIVNTYDAEIASMDAGFGHLIAALKARGLYDRTVIVFTSDHGEEFGEHGAMGWHSHTLYDELLRVPLIVKLPSRARAGAEVARQVRGIDIAPTILDALGLKPEPRFSGLSLVPLVASAGDRPLPAVLWRETMPQEKGVFSGIRMGEWKLHPNGLFHLSSDPRETRNLAAQKAEVHSQLDGKLDQILRSRQSLRSDAVPVDAKTRVSLRALGYIQ